MKVRKIRPIQNLNSCCCPNSADFNPAAKPGMLMVGEEPRHSINFKPAKSEIRWVKMPHFRYGVWKEKVIYVVYLSDDDLALAQRPLSAEITGELIIGKRYRLTAQAGSTCNGQTFYTVKAEEES